MKSDGSIHICGDYRLTMSKAAKVDSYPILRVEDLFASLAGGKTLAKLDVVHAYLQLPLDEVLCEYVTISTAIYG